MSTHVVKSSGEVEELCGEVDNTGLVLCRKAPHAPDEQHWGLKDDGMDVVWATITLRPPGRP